MRGLPFPSGALRIHDDSHENDYGSPVPTSGPGGSGDAGSGIPIDPELGGSFGGLNGGHEKVGEWNGKVCTDFISTGVFACFEVKRDATRLGFFFLVDGIYAHLFVYFQQYDDPFQHASSSGTLLYRGKYGQGPQGDPFAPQLPAFYQEEEVIQIVRQKPVKKKRKIKREEECGFCQGNDKSNKDGESEVMITCSECGRSGMNLLY